MRMTDEQIKEHQKNPNVTIRIPGNQGLFYCNCGCNVFHHIDDDNIFICNSCKEEYIGVDDNNAGESNE